VGNFNSLVLARAELGPFVSYAYRMPKEDAPLHPFAVGGELAVQGLLNRVRISMDVSRNLEQEWFLAARAGLTDFNGILYWIGRTMWP
jgi:hypothetical protein